MTDIDNASGAGMETVAWLGRVDHHTGIRTPTDELVRRTDASRLLAEKEGELQRLRADAERYRWLRSHSYIHTPGGLNFGTGCRQTMPELLDAAIDAALKP